MIRKIRSSFKINGLKVGMIENKASMFSLSFFCSSAQSQTEMASRMFALASASSLPWLIQLATPELQPQSTRLRLESKPHPIADNAIAPTLYPKKLPKRLPL
jgi:hypothetical protein